MNCSECDAVLVDKKPTVAVDAKKNLFAVIQIALCCTIMAIYIHEIKIKNMFLNIMLSYAL